ncbi:hypothetical protein [Desulfolutivibrio sulfoxidireducens]|uniref:hypothetical protein n=1 Tax=Desulfolutivibrio sulfoxidireducens TaxID=2773299 RepID=UPI00159D350A|nr:hypothetical protein [Desulfolutivibrio sulfoxidireducens]QLA20152.1 hypothetical protein GD604_10705 [Desulfolutivibrio sulfoxidireducens]
MNSLGRFCKWFFLDPMSIWLFLLSLFFMLLIAGYLNSEFVVRLSGVVYVFVGVFCVIYNIYKISTKYKLKNPFEKFMDWLSRYPFNRKMKIAYGSASGTAIVGGKAKGVALFSNTKGMVLEKRVDIIEEMVGRCYTRIQNLESDTTAKFETTMSEVGEIRKLISEVEYVVGKKIENVETNSLDLIAAGTCLMFLGTVISTFSKEILCMIISS